METDLTMHNDDRFQYETISVKYPNGHAEAMRITAKYTEDDIDIARRVASRYPLNSVIRVADSAFRIVRTDPLELQEVSKKSAQATSREPKAALAVAVGQRWVTKDSRRKQDPFAVVEVADDHILTDRGVKIQLHRLNRYQMVS